MTSHSDEEAVEPLVAPEGQRQAPVLIRRSVQHALLGSALILGALLVAVWPGTAGQSHAPAQVKSLRFEQKRAITDAALAPKVAVERNAKRPRLIVEEDLTALLPRHATPWRKQAAESSREQDSAVCFERAEQLFHEVASGSALDAELEAREFAIFKHRFATAMKERCKEATGEALWLQAAAVELDRQKPLMTAARAAALNAADLGFRVKMHDWLLHESPASMPGRLGLLPTSPDQKSILKRPGSARRADATLPSVFRAELKWPGCKEEILRIHNQGHCGSCWAFGGLAAIDARMCIASNGGWNAPKDILSRLHVTSCASEEYWPGHDGCQGGHPHWPMEMMAKSGVVSTACLPYYIGGQGVEHFQRQDSAPPCETHCQGGYSMPMRNDTFSSAGVANYDWLVSVHGDVVKINTMKVAIYEEGPVAFAFFANSEFMGYHSGVFSVCTGLDRPNHAVYAFGWGIVPGAEGGDAVEYIEASNSWGTDWGAEGHFRIHPRCVTDVTIPGSLERNIVSHQVGSVDPLVPRDPTNDFWPWPQPEECPYTDHDGCVSDLESWWPYTDNEVCVSHKLDGKRLMVKEFELERGYDFLTVNGKAFTGAAGEGYDGSLAGLVVDARGIRFESDKSMAKAGFRICALAE